MNEFTISGSTHLAPRLAAGLYIVATPIGNLGDMTLRGLATLAAADMILAEDKRVSKVLMAHFGIKTPLKSYHEHNAEAMRPEIMSALREGQVVAQISDAGTPLISDPGFKLVEAALAEGFNVVPIPGASAIMAALVAAGLPTDRFFFEGFLPSRSTERRRRIRALETVPGTLVFFEAPHRVIETIADLAQVLGGRQAAVARELTKRYEEVRRGALTDLATQYAAEDPPRGEVVILVAGPSDDMEAMTEEAIDAKIIEALELHSAKDAAAVVSATLGLPKRQVYARVIALSQNRENPDRDNS